MLQFTGRRGEFYDQEEYKGRAILPQPACREPWPDPQSRDIKLAEPPYSPVPGDPPDLGHAPSVMWPGYAPSVISPGNAPNPRGHEPHGGAGVRAAVSVPEPWTLGLFAFGVAALFALRRCSRRRA
jgi:hypothetical protein